MPGREIEIDVLLIVSLYFAKMVSFFIRSRPPNLMTGDPKDALASRFVLLV